MNLRRPVTTLLLLGASAASPLASAIEPIPQSAGWRGFLLIGAGNTDVESNLVAGNQFIDLDTHTIASVNDAPQSDDVWHPVITGEINYTFGDQWQAFFGTSLEDAVTLDGVAQLGLRKEVAGIGTLQGGFLFSGIPSEVWEDPYAEGARRDESDRDSTGLRLQWDRVLGSVFELTFSYRDISVDTERSGHGLVSVTCNAACQDLLRRDGDQYAFDVSYLFRPGDGRSHLLRPMVRYTVDERDGDAIAGDSYRLQLSYIFLGERFTVASNVAFGSASQDEANPIYGVKTDADRFTVDATLFYRLPAASGRWQAVGNVFWAEEDSEVTFHDSEVLSLSIGAMYRFGDR